MDKRHWLVISFQSTHDAMRAEKLFQEHDIKGLIIPTPRKISASCGLCWRMVPDLREVAAQILDYNSITLTGWHDIEM